LKSVVADFYDVECLSKANFRVMEDIDKLNLSTKRRMLYNGVTVMEGLLRRSVTSWFCFSSWMNISLILIYLPTSQVLKTQCQACVCTMEI